MAESLDQSWHDLLFAKAWKSEELAIVEEGMEFTYADLDDAATLLEEQLKVLPAGARVLLKSKQRVRHMAGQLACWRSQLIPISDDGAIPADAVQEVQPSARAELKSTGCNVEIVEQHNTFNRFDQEKIVAVNFSSGTTGLRKAIAVSSTNLLTLMYSKSFAELPSGTSVANFARPNYDGWWFDVWRSIAQKKPVIVLPSMDEDIFEWAELVDFYRISQALLPAAVCRALLEVAPEAIQNIDVIYSGGEPMRTSTYELMKQNAPRARLFNIYGPTEATFATHMIEMTEALAERCQKEQRPVPIGYPIAEMEHDLVPSGGGRAQLVVRGPGVCHSYIRSGELTSSFEDSLGERCYATGDLALQDSDGCITLDGRIDSVMKVHGIRVDSAKLEYELTEIPGISNAAVVQTSERTLAIVESNDDSRDDAVFQNAVSVANKHSSAIRTIIRAEFPMRPGGKIDMKKLKEQAQGDFDE